MTLRRLAYSYRRFRRVRHVHSQGSSGRMCKRHMAEDGYFEDSVYLFYHTTVVVYFKGKFCYSIVLFGCETLFLTVREENWLRVFEGTVLGKIFGPME